MTPGKAIAQIQRMIAYREKRLADYQGGNDSYLRAEIAALTYALELAEREWSQEVAARAMAAAKQNAA